MAELEVVINDEALRTVINDAEGTTEAVRALCESIAGKANSMAAGYRSGVWHEYGAKHPPGNGKWVDRGGNFPTKGNTQARYAQNVQKRSGRVVGIVYTANHAAQKENMQHNTLLKSL